MVIIPAFLTSRRTLVPANPEDVDFTKPLYAAVFEQDGDLTDEDKKCPVKVVRYLGNEDLLSENQTRQALILSQSAFVQSGKHTETRAPVIHLSTVNWDEPDNGNAFVRAFRYTDSSIWNYHLRFGRNPETQKLVFEDNDKLSWILTSIERNYKRGLYSLSACHEYANLNARLIAQSYLEGMHAQIAPFIFHSEYKMKSQWQKEIGELKQLSDIWSFRWRILLIDDKSNQQMNRVDKEQSSVTKLGIILPLVEELGWKVSARKYDSAELVPESTSVLIEYAETMDEGVKALQTKKYDIVLFDYLLKEGAHNHFGYEILCQIDRNEIKVLPGPHNRLFCMFISAYTTAVNDRLSAETLDRSESQKWHIAEGACPTNTPNRFQLLLLRLMRKRIEDSGIMHLTATYISEKLMSPIYTRKDKRSIRARAADYYYEGLSLLFHYRNLLKDVQVARDGAIFNSTGSVLITESLTRFPQFGGFLEHLVHLIRLTAFGTVRQWPEMWEEYIFFKSQFYDMYHNLIGAEDGFELLCDDIESYILNLKSLE